MSAKNLLFLTAIVASCAQNASKNIRWDGTAQLPPDADGTPHKGLAGAAIGSMDDILLIAGGANFPSEMPWDGGAKHYADDAFLYRIAPDGMLEFLERRKLENPLAYAGNCSAGDAVYVAGGENDHGATNSVRKFTLKGDSLIVEGLPDLPAALANGSLAHASGKLYFIGGENAQTVSDRIYVLDLSAKEPNWTDFCALPYPVSHAVAVSDGKNKLYIVGGRMRNPTGISTIYGQLLAVDLPSATAAAIAALPRPTAAGTGMMDGSGNIILFGGDDGGTFHQVEALIAKIGRTTDPEEKNALIAEKADVQRGHPGFSTEVWTFSLKDGQWEGLADLPAPSPVTTTALPHGDLVIIPSGEIRAGLRTDRILVGKTDF